MTCQVEPGLLCSGVWLGPPWRETAQVMWNNNENKKKKTKHYNNKKMQKLRQQQNMAAI